MDQNQPKPNSLPSCGHKATNITSLNYHDKAKAFMQATQGERGSFGYLIDPTNQPQQWGAWKGYFLKIGKRSALARFKAIEQEHDRFSHHNRERKASNTYIVPASMPSDFDEDQDWYSDQMAGDKFIAEAEARKAKIEKFETVEYRKAVVFKALGYNPGSRRTDPKPGRVDSNWSKVV